MGSAGWRRIADDALVECVRRGRPRGFELIYGRYRKPLLARSLRLLGSREEAEDAVQQAFLKAYLAICASERPIVLAPWLFAITRNECISMIRRRRDARASGGPATVASAGAAEEVELREEVRALLADLARLPAAQRTALLLSGVGGMPGSRVAGLVGCDREQVKALVFRARRSLDASRQARATSCAEIRDQLSELRGGSLRRKPLREHLSGCESCREFRRELRESR
jgi:RNA polymerase sigma factor (sigma-70 family)